MEKGLHLQCSFVANLIVEYVSTNWNIDGKTVTHLKKEAKKYMNKEGEKRGPDFTLY